MCGILTRGMEILYSRLMTAEEKIIALSDKKLEFTANPLLVTALLAVSLHTPILITFHVEDEEEKSVSGTRQGGEGLKLLTMVL